MPIRGVGLIAAAPNPLAAGEWADQAACKGTPLPLWYPEGKTQRAVARKAIMAYCDRCPVRQYCEAAGAVEAWGVWGGQMPKTQHERPKKINMSRSKESK